MTQLPAVIDRDMIVASGRTQVVPLLIAAAGAAGIATKLGNHSFRATENTAYLKNGGTLEKAAQMANHASTRTTKLYERIKERLTQDQVEMIRL